MQTLWTSGNSAEIDFRAARPQGLEGNAGHELGEVEEFRDLQLPELFAAQHLNADGNLLDVFSALLRRHDHFFQRSPARFDLLRVRNTTTRQCG